MFTTLFIRELQGYLYGLRFQISFAIFVPVFIFGTLSSLSSLHETRESYAKISRNDATTLANRAGNLSSVAVSTSHYLFPPKDYLVVDDCKEEMLPNKLTYTAYQVSGFEVQQGGANPFLKRAQGLNWSFILSMLLSFMTLLLAYDSISGEKEDHTLSLVFSNRVSRGSYLIAKFFGIVTALFCVALVGVTGSILAAVLSKEIQIDGAFLTNVVGFLGTSLLFISVMAVIGLLASTLSKQSNISLLICLTVWMFLAVVYPNSSLFLANKVFPIPDYLQVQAEIQQEADDINRNAPEGSWASNGGNPFYPRHELRANNQTNLLNARRRRQDAYYDQMFRQFENTRLLGIFSPMAQFEQMNEGVLGGGYLRFKKNWNDLHVFQASFLQWFKDLDAKDEKSPHWYNPYEDYSTSRQPVAVDQIPVYTEKPAAFSERLAHIRGYLLAMIALFGILLALCFVRFLRYDVR
ncbi:MAG: ABC transporter permease [Culturomica sp.]|jgi:ABC-type transport system involved in multi-copper enzyme maturation permease subunit|nr:ABC transporter permease [Culturomica sp.]